ncbi:MAG: hypothetical protein OER77_17815 [Myxococcales bacterium]|nr:hypothetical protein [Myxococcales bacterium]
MPFLHWAEKRFARALARQQLGFYRAVQNENPSLPKLDLYAQTLMRHPGYDAERARTLVRQTEDGVSWWPHDREPTFRDIVHYLAVTEYTKGEDHDGTHVVFKKIIDKLIPADL